MDDPRTLVSTDWVAAHLHDPDLRLPDLHLPDLRVIDASWYLPDAGRDARAEYDAAHLRGAQFLDIDDISDKGSDLPHMAPPVEKFASRMRSLGIGDGQQVVIYDGAGLFSAARAWWLFRLMGMTDVAVMDGGLPKWLAEGRAVETLPPSVKDCHISVRRNAALVRDVTQVAAAAKLGDHEIVDARSPARFRGEVPEPRPGLQAGHIPGARNVPYTSVLNADATMKSPEALRAVFAAAGVDLDRPVITTCGSGVTAAVLSLALERMGHRDHSLYDGSWAEWGAGGDLPVAKG